MVLGVLPGGRGPQFPDPTPLDVGRATSLQLQGRLSVRVPVREGCVCRLFFRNVRTLCPGQLAGPAAVALGNRAAPGPDPPSYASAPAPALEKPCARLGRTRGGPPSHRYGPERVCLPPAPGFPLRPPHRRCPAATEAQCPGPCPDGCAQPSGRALARLSPVRRTALPSMLWCGALTHPAARQLPSR